MTIIKIRVEDHDDAIIGREEKESMNKTVSTTNEMLEKVGVYNPYSLFITVSMGFLWFLSAMPTLAPAYLAPSESCENCTFLTVQKEFNLNKTFIDPGEMTSSIYFVGNFAMGQIYATLADRIGRRPVLVWSLLVSGLSGTLAAFSPSFNLLLLGRFFQGSFFNSITMVNWVMCCESIAFSAHGLASVLFGLFWVLGYCALTPIAIYFPSWRSVQLSSSFPCFIFGLLMYFTLPESISFLVVKRRRHETEQWISNAEKYGGNAINCDVVRMIENESAQVVDDDVTLIKSLKHLMTDSLLLKYTAIQAVLWIVDFMLYNALSLMATGIGGNNPHVAYLFSGLVELPSYILMPATLDYLGRKPTVMGSHLLSAIALFIMYYVNPVDHNIIYLICWLTAKFGMSCAFMCCFVYGSEIFPIQYRNICLGMCATLSNIGAMMSPHCNLLDDIYPGLMYLSFSSLAVLCSLLTISLPETKNAHND